MQRSVLIIILLLWSQDAVKCLRILDLRVPAHAAVGGEALLGCQFEMDGAQLCSVKWYKGNREFYRYVPLDKPPAMFFSTPGVFVDINRSSSNVVALTHLTMESAGLYRCEVSGEAPLFQFAFSESNMAVYLLPEEDVQITKLPIVLNVGDRVSTNCTTFRSNPAVELKWRINGEPAPKEYVEGPYLRMAGVRQNAIDTILRLDFVVQEEHFAEGFLQIECQATLAPLYHREATFTIHPNLGPQRKQYTQNENNEELEEIEDNDKPTFVSPISNTTLPHTQTEAPDNASSLKVSTELLVLSIALLVYAAIGPHKML